MDTKRSTTTMLYYSTIVDLYGGRTIAKMAFKQKLGENFNLYLFHRKPIILDIMDVSQFGNLYNWSCTNPFFMIQWHFNPPIGKPIYVKNAK